MKIINNNQPFLVRVMLISLHFLIELEFGVLIFVEGGKPENPSKNPWSRDENQNSTRMWCRVWESYLGHSSGRRVLLPLHLPFSLWKLNIMVTPSLQQYNNNNNNLNNWINFIKKLHNKLLTRIKRLKEHLSNCYYHC